MTCTEPVKQDVSLTQQCIFKNTFVHDAVVYFIHESNFIIPKLLCSAVNNEGETYCDIQIINKKTMMAKLESWHAVKSETENE